MRIVNKVINNKNKEIPLHELTEDYYNYNVPKSKWRFSKILTNISNLAVNKGTQTDFKNFLVKNFAAIIKSTPDQLAQFVVDVDRDYPNLLFYQNKQQPFGKVIENVFNYSGFRQTSKAKWFAKTLNIKTCLYCNAQFTLSINKQSSSGMLFQFDHFFSKSRYPFLSLSMCNLIPSCSNCNIAKSKKDFNLNNALHPYKEDMNNLLKFRVSNPDILDYILGKDLSKLGIMLKHKSLKVQRHIDTFSLDKVYNEHTDFIEELMLKAYHYDASTRRELSAEFSTILDENTIKRFILGNYYLDSDLNKRPLAKMTKDIAIQLNIID